MRGRATATAFLLAAVTCSGCHGNPTTPVSPTPPSLSTVTVRGVAPTVGATAQFSATATLSDGTTQTVTAQATWASSSTSIATVASAGLVTGVSAGEADITATYQSVSGTAHVNIARPQSSTYTISGVVRDGTSGGILPDITVQALDSAGNAPTTKTDSTGAYSIGGLVAGTVTLTASAISYQTTKVTVVISSDARADITLPRTVCTFTLSAESLSFGAAGGSAALTVVSHATGCVWTARSRDAFITIKSGETGIDNGTVTLSVAANTGVARSGTVTIAGQTVTVAQVASAPTCGPDLATPVLVYTGKEDDLDAFGQPFTRYKLDVSNKSAFPDELFAAAPDLPACGLNTNSSRTWLYIYARDGHYLYGFCALGSAANMGDIWFGLPRTQSPPDGVYITLTDRKCSRITISNVANIR